MPPRNCRTTTCSTSDRSASAARHCPRSERSADCTSCPARLGRRERLGDRSRRRREVLSPVPAAHPPARESRCAISFSPPRRGSNSSRRRAASAMRRSTRCGGWRWPIPASPLPCSATRSASRCGSLPPRRWRRRGAARGIPRPRVRRERIADRRCSRRRPAYRAGRPADPQPCPAARSVPVRQRQAGARPHAGRRGACAYQDFLARDRHPMVALFLDGPAAEVDVNVHPAKAEVRFRDAALVRGLIVGALRRALDAAGHRASTTVADAALAAFRPGDGAMRAAWEPRFAFTPRALPRELAEARSRFSRRVPQKPATGTGGGAARHGAGAIAPAPTSSPRPPRVSVGRSGRGA